jgi:hypothetical protein
LEGGRKLILCPFSWLSHGTWVRSFLAFLVRAFGSWLEGLIASGYAVLSIGRKKSVEIQGCMLFPLHDEQPTKNC